MAEDRLEEDPVGQPRCQGFLASELTRLIGVWGRANGLAAGTKKESVFGLAFLSSEKRLAIARVARDGAVLSGGIRFVSALDGLETGACRPRDVPPHTPSPGCFGLDVDAKDRLLAAMTDGTVRLFDGPTGNELRRFDLVAEIVRFAGPRHFVTVVTALGAHPSPFSDCGLGRGKMRCSVHEIESGEQVAELPLEGTWISGVAVNEAGDRIAIAYRSWLRVVDAKCAKLWEVKLDEGLSTSGSPLAFSPDGRLLAVALWGSGVRLHDGATGAVVKDYASQRRLESPTFSHDGQRLACFAGGRYVMVAEAATGKPLRETEHLGAERFAWSRDDRTLAAGDFSGRAQIFAADTLAPVGPSRPFLTGFGVDESRVALGLPQTNEVVIADRDGAVQRRVGCTLEKGAAVLGITEAGVLVRGGWHGPVFAIDGTKTSTIAERVEETALVSAGRLVVTGHADATVFGGGAAPVVLSGAHRDEFISEGDTEHHEVSAAAVSPDGRRAATGSSDSTIALWSLPEGKLLRQIQVLRDGYVRMRAFALAFSRDASLLFAVVNGVGINAYESETGTVRYTVRENDPENLPHVPPATALDRRLVACAVPDGVLLFNPDDGHVEDRLTLGDAPAALAFSGPQLFVQTSRGLLLRFALAD